MRTTNINYLWKLVAELEKRVIALETAQAPVITNAVATQPFVPKRRGRPPKNPAPIVEGSDFD